jgi:ribosome-associated protein
MSRSSDPSQGNLPGNLPGNSDPNSLDSKSVLNLIKESLDKDKAEDIVVIELAGKSDIADYMVVATGRSNRHIASLADHLQFELKAKGFHKVTIEGIPGSDWVLLDAGDVIVHLFPEEIRSFYNLEKLWSFEPSARKSKPQI